MDTLVSYLIRSVLVSGLMLGYYQLALRNRRSHSFNRTWLLTTLLASIVLPFVQIRWLTWHTATREVVVLNAAGTHPATGPAMSASTVGLALSAAVSLVLLAILGWRIYRIYRLKRSRSGQRLGGCLLIEVRDRRAPFSFLKNLFWQEGADIHDPVQRKILDHELAHIRGGHTYDNLFAQTLAAVIWMNPFNWLIRRELQMIHEFIADNASIPAGDTETFALMLLQAYDDGRYLDPSHHLIHSPIKRRLRMISSSKPPSGLWKALALPVLLAGVVLACSKEQSAPGAAPAIKQVQFTKPVTLTLAQQLKLKVDSFTVISLDEQGITKRWRVAQNEASSFKVKLLVDSVAQDNQIGVRVSGMPAKLPPPPPPQLDK